MSYQQGQPTPAAAPPQQAQEQPQQQQTPEQIQNAEADRLLQEILGGEIPGQGYLIPVSPEDREKILVPTDPDKVRSHLLRSIETMAIALQLPYGAEKKGELGKALLECSQAYLLLDPSVDEQGVPIGAQATADAEAQQQTREHAGTVEKDVNEHQGHVQAALAAHASGQDFKRPVAQSGYVEPPRVQPNPAEQQIADKHKSQSQELKGARGDRPLPRPRAGA